MFFNHMYFLIIFLKNTTKISRRRNNKDSILLKGSHLPCSWILVTNFIGSPGFWVTWEGVERRLMGLQDQL